MLDILMAGGWAMLPILAASAVALAIILERYWTLRRKAVLPDGLGDQVRAWARSRSLDPQHLATLAAGSPLGELLAGALAVRNRPRDIIKERIEDTGRHVVHRLERYLNTLGTIALIAPLLGLLGTVIGLIRMFMAVMVNGAGDPAKMAGGIGEALICTASRPGGGDSGLRLSPLLPRPCRRLRGGDGTAGRRAARRAGRAHRAGPAASRRARRALRPPRCASAVPFARTTSRST